MTPTKHTFGAFFLLQGLIFVLGLVLEINSFSIGPSTGRPALLYWALVLEINSFSIGPSTGRPDLLYWALVLEINIFLLGPPLESLQNEGCGGVFFLSMS